MDPRDIAGVESLTTEAMSAEKKKKEDEKKREALFAALKKTKTAEKQSVGEKEMDKGLVKEHFKNQEKLKEDLEAIDIRDNLYMIKRYLSSFPGLAAEIPPLSSKASLAETQHTLELIRELRARMGSVDRVAAYTKLGLASLESWWGDGQKSWLPEGLRWNVKGLSTHFSNQRIPSLNEMVMEMDLEYPWIGRQPFLMRFVGALMEAMHFAHMMNTDDNFRRLMESATQTPPAEIPPELLKQLH